MPDGNRAGAAAPADVSATPRTGTGLTGLEAAMLAHDLSNAVQAAMMDVASIRYVLHDPAQIERLVGLVRQSLSHLSDRVGATLAVRSPGSRDDLAPIDVASLLRECEEILGVDAASRRLALECDDEQPVPVCCRAAEFADVVRNLVRNAARASRPGSRITVAIRREGRAEAAALELPSGDYGVVRVIDHGVGMDAATLSQAREPYFTTKPSARGHGLGLAAADRFATLHGGLLHLESAPMQGTIAAIWLPLASEHVALPHVPLRPTTAESALVVQRAALSARTAARPGGGACPPGPSTPPLPRRGAFLPARPRTRW